MDSFIEITSGGDPSAATKHAKNSSVSSIWAPGFPKLAKGDFGDFGGSEPPEPLLEPKSSPRRNSWRVL